MKMLAGILIAVLALGARADVSEVRGWFEEQLAEAAQPFVIPGYLVEIEVVYPPTLSGGEVAAMADRVTACLDHPDRARYEEQLRRLETNGDHERYSFAILDDQSLVNQ